MPPSDQGRDAGPEDEGPDEALGGAAAGPGPDAGVSVAAHGVERVVAALPADELTELAAFVRSYYAQVAPEDLASRRPAYLAAAARGHHDLARRRRPGETLVRAFSPAPDGPSSTGAHTVVAVVTDDMPFLVDSVTMELDRHATRIHLVVHPVLAVRRSHVGDLVQVAAPAERDTVAEAFVHVEIDRETDVAALRALEADLHRVLHDVRRATADWEAMVAALRAVDDDLGTHPPPVPEPELAEARALLGWMVDDHFTFLGARDYDLTPEGDRLVPRAGTGLGILRDDAPADATRLGDAARRRAREPHVLVLTKAGSRATVHRPTHLDYVGVKRVGPDGAVVGEHRFLGLWAESVYSSRPTDIPVLREKVAAVLHRAEFAPGSHRARDLAAILDGYPRDELFQIDVDELATIADGILHLRERRRVRLFVRHDSYGRFVSCLVYVPRDRYSTAMRERVLDLLREAYRAANLEWTTQVSGSPLARLHVVLRVEPGTPTPVDVRALEARIAAVSRSWTDDLRDALVAEHGEERGLALLPVYAEAFPASYRDDHPATDAVADIARLEVLSPEPGLDLRLAAEPDAHAGILTLSLLGLGDPPSLSELMPLLADMGVSVLDERPSLVTPRGRPPVWIEQFDLRPEAEVPVLRPTTFQNALAAVVRGDAESDGLNRLVLGAGLTWQEVVVLRAYTRYLRQVGTPFSQRYLEDALARNPRVAALLVETFRARLDPDRVDEAAEDAEVTDRRAHELANRLDAVATLDDDRILRSYRDLVLATVRTTFFCSRRLGAVALKLDPAAIPGLPRPRPAHEIFVYDPRVEGVHLRTGPVARGGIRWSDRREDFRAEVLDLMKAQRVKNAVIVPGGAKGGFVVKRPPAGHDALHAEVVACYRTFVGALLDLTDNLVGGEVVPPARVVRLDGDDPYLVVAADKGTATFSDLANELAAERGYWLGDAFASGGSVGYDHKRMAITARGAWESVRHHFRSLGIDADRDPITVVGIGDMSGDVFGNGMLRSPHLRLVAAFDHRHVLLDPDPDPERSFRERRRLFELPESSWADYAVAALSPGGGVHSRREKSIPLSPEVRARLDVDADALPPEEVVRAILRAPVDLLWNGGIGTFVKSSTERHADVADRTNDAVRVDATQLRCRVVAEGGNLGLTERARAEFALSGGLLNTDAIDNSAGVDLSDHEVNCKILLDLAVRDGAVAGDERDRMLLDAAEEVAALVLRDNDRQNRALGLARAHAHEDADLDRRFLDSLETAGHLDRVVEALPDDETIVARRAAGGGLVVPELAVLLAYAKITLADELVTTDVPDDPDLGAALTAYFPAAWTHRLAAVAHRHPLRRELVATILANELVNRSGITFVHALGEETGAGVAELVRAHEAARRIADEPALTALVDDLDHAVTADTQRLLSDEVRRLVRRSTRWLLRHGPRPLRVEDAVARYRPTVEALGPDLDAILGEGGRASTAARADGFTAAGVPADVARRVATLDARARAFDVVEVAVATDTPPGRVATVLGCVGDRLGLHDLRERIVALPTDQRWASLSRSALRDDADGAHRTLATEILAGAPTATDPEAAVDEWVAGHAEAVDRARRLLADVATTAGTDVGALAVAVRGLRDLSSAG